MTLAHASGASAACPTRPRADHVSCHAPGIRAACGRGDARVAREMVCVSGLVCHAVRSFALVLWPKPECRVVHCRILSIDPKLDLLRLSQLGRHATCPGFSSKRLQLFARERNRIRRKMGDVAMEGRTPVIVLADTAVAQQVVPPSECTRALYGRRSHGHLPIFLRKTDQPFRSAILSGVMLFRSCTARCLRASNVVAAVGEVSAAPS